jgi:hypothetical protein
MKIVTSRAFDMLIYYFSSGLLPIAFGFQGVRQLACITPIQQYHVWEHWGIRGRTCSN